MVMVTCKHLCDGQKPRMALQRGTGAVDRRTAARTVSCEIVTRSRAPTHASKVQECMCKQQNNMWAFRGAVNHCIWRSWRRAVAGTVALQLGTIGVAVSNSNLNL